MSGLQPAQLEEHCSYTGGKYAVGSCWYFGRQGDSCTQVCESRGFFYDRATANYAGSKKDGGTLSGCRRIASVFGDRRPTTFSHNRVPYAHLGCAKDYIDLVDWYRSGPTTSDAKHRLYGRYCACHQYCPTSIVKSGKRSCWYHGAPGDNCNETCARAPGNLQYDQQTATFAGSEQDGGTFERCRQVVQLFSGRQINPNRGDHFSMLGCFSLIGGPQSVWASQGPTIASASLSDARRYCACEPK